MSDGKPGETTIKTLFAMSGNVCAFRDPERKTPTCEESLTDPAWKSVKARVCHIAGRRPESARYDETMTDEERAHFDNLILMCPTHHVLIDELEPDRFPVEILREMKGKALEASGPRMGSQQWATDAQMDSFVALASVAMERQYVAEEAPVTLTLPGAVRTTPKVNDAVGLSVSGTDSGSSSGSGETSVPRLVDLTDPGNDQQERDRYAIQVRQILGYDNVISIDESSDPGRIDITTNWRPSDLEFEKLGDLGRVSGFSWIVRAAGEERLVQ